MTSDITLPDWLAPAPESSSLLNGALRLGAQGLPVFPCDPQQKRPWTRTGFKAATTDRTQIISWWTSHPNAAIGMPTGTVSGLVVIDLDKRPDKDGVAAFRALEAPYGRCPRTPVVRTPGGGQHLYFRHPGGTHRIPSTANKLAVGVDVRGDGGYVLVSPSAGYLIEGRAINDAPDLPSWLLDKIVQKNEPAASEVEIASGRDSLVPWQNIEDALQCIPPDCSRDEWIRVGMALHLVGTRSGDNACARKLWDTWSQGSSEKYPGERELKRQWRSFKEKDDGVTLGTLFHIAREYGYRETVDAGELFKDVEASKSLHSSNKTNPFAWTEDFRMTDEEIEELADPDWIFPNLIISGHLIVIPAEPNGGKTTIFEWVCSQISSSHRVIYVNADISAGDAKEAHRRAKEGKYELLLPDMKPGLSMDDVVQQLVDMNSAGGDLSDVVMVFDTLKKMADVISKKAASTLYKTLRGLTAKGMTIVLLAHTNKYRGEDGKPVFEGTGDLRADVDEMIYLIPKHHDDGSMTVSTDPDKVRGSFKPISFEITTGRQVHPVEYVDTARENHLAAQRAKDDDDIRIIDAFLSTGEKNQSEIVVQCGHHQISRSRVLKLLKRYTIADGGLWVRRNDPINNAAIYAKRNVFEGQLH